jgi:hypothetical protein
MLLNRRNFIKALIAAGAGAAATLYLPHVEEAQAPVAPPPPIEPTPRLWALDRTMLPPANTPTRQHNIGSVMVKIETSGVWVPLVASQAIKQGTPVVVDGHGRLRAALASECQQALGMVHRDSFVSVEQMNREILDLLRRT